MTTYYKQAEIKASMKRLVDHYLEDCKKCHVLSEDFIALIKHNFLASYVSYNKKTQTIEVGIEEDGKDDDFYPNIKVYKYPLNSNKKWLERSFRNEKNDLAFYGRLLNRTKTTEEAEIVVL
ncbi:hypothetical protein FHG64_05970 [Antarcticibacterium flavum]|uniref:Uncharacterized protein n=1 Tax=Antarcticibacterium flavum TaxID=2058175 RepID=A0A5B7X0W4_9FLAO|nr:MULTISPECIES: hypothetical protein [Antarcticibacterium]MCM4160945.1 hypothetical protein [Antarcticibacterium sp. W02-3]QCY68987.1 hypothetical protein FHG64_05970 [Antarcticibacterium flavum]